MPPRILLTTAATVTAKPCADDVAAPNVVAPDVAEPRVREATVPESADGQRVDLFLTQICDGYSRSQMTQAVQAEGCQIDGRVVRPSVKVRRGQRVRFRLPEPAGDETVPERIDLDILYEDDGLVVVNKPAGMVVHPARGNWTGTLTSALAYRFRALSDVGGPTRPGIVHRLDRDTSGVIVVAKTNAVHMDLAAQFQRRTVEKEYVAIAAGPLDRDRDWIDAPIGRHPYQRDKQAIRAGDRTSKPAKTFYEVIGRYGRFTHVRVMPQTGRTHQIRVHLAHLGAPILCDRLYAGHAEATAGTLGDPEPADRDAIVLRRQALHARRLSFRNPQTATTMSFEAPLPEDMATVISCLGRIAGRTHDASRRPSPPLEPPSR